MMAILPALPQPAREQQAVKRTVSPLLFSIEAFIATGASVIEVH
jgi:hypothetical protein